jgi:hypothetical protein
MEPFLKPEKLAEEVLCEIAGVRRGTSPGEAAGLLSTASLQINCYLVPVALLGAEKHAEAMRGDGGLESRANMTDCAWAPSCFPYPDSDSSQNYSRVGQGLDDEEAEKAREKSCFTAKLTWDIWEECDPLKPTFLMPVHQVTKLSRQYPYDDDTERCVLGLLLYRDDEDAEEGNAKLNRFKRAGHFQLDSSSRQTAFWQAALRREPIQGVDLVERNGVAIPVSSNHESEKPALDKIGRGDCVLQYQIELV